MVYLPAISCLLISLLVSQTAARAFEFRRWRPESIESQRAASTLQPFHHVSRLQQSGVKNIRNVRYTMNVTVNGQGVSDYVLALDTGSTDVWVYPLSTDLGVVNDTGIPLELHYGDGSYGVKGNISFAPFRLGEFDISTQAFLAVQEGNVRGISDIGIDGLFGLAFDQSFASPINLALKRRYGPNSTIGRSVLSNIFAQDPTTPNFIALDFSRTEDLEDDDGGTFSVGEYAEMWAAVRNATKLPQFPKRGLRWTTLLEGITVDGVNLTLESTIPSVPDGHLLALLDTGDPSALISAKLQNEIYSRVPGAALLEDGLDRIWVLPCNTTTSVSFRFGGQSFPIHPLDLSTFSKTIIIDGQARIACLGTISGTEDGWGGNELEVSLGGTFLRNVYSVFDFGDEAGEPYMQLLGQIDPEKAASEVVAVRNRTMASLPPELPPAELVKFLADNRSQISVGEQFTSGHTASPNSMPASRTTREPPETTSQSQLVGSVQSSGTLRRGHDQTICHLLTPVITWKLAVLLFSTALVCM